MIRVLCLLLATTAHADEADEVKWHREAVQAARQQQFEEAEQAEATTAWTWVQQCNGRVCVSRGQLCRMQPCTKP